MESETDEFKYESIKAEDIQSDRANLQFLILRQLDRTNYLLSINLAAKQDQKTKRNLVLGIESSIRSLECLMITYLAEDYFERKKVIMGKLNGKYEFPCDECKKKTGGYPKVQLLYDCYCVGGYGTYHQFFNGAESYAEYLCEWLALLIENLHKANLMPTKKQRFDFEG